LVVLVPFVLIRRFKTSPRQSSFFTPARDECGGENGQRPFHDTTLCQSRPKLN
jgi:hypothetical protein